MTPLDIVSKNYSLPKELYGNPFELHPLQVQSINTAAPLTNVGVFLDTGTGKTVVETVLALYRMIQGAETTVVIMPPILVRQWAKWLSFVKKADGSPLTVTEYRGSPKERSKLRLDVDFVLVGIQIFKRDYARFVDHFHGRRYHVAVDEATMLSNVDSDNHQKVYEFAMGMTQDLLTGTPINDPMNAYGLLKFTNPGCYRSLKHFENVHVEERDFWGKPCKFSNLDILRDNLKQNAVRILFEEMYPDVETPLFIPMNYDLDPAHLELYNELAEGQLLALENGGKIDATSANSLFHALGQIIVNYGHFSGNPKHKSATLGMVQERLDEIGGKLVIFANYRMSVRLITAEFKHVNAVAINGDATRKAKEAAVTRFVEDPSCRLITINPKSGGLGLDGLQHVCNHMMFVEPVRSPRDFHQCVARLKRTGQRRRVVVALPTAEGTLQVRAFQSLVKNDTIAARVIRNAVELRAAIFGK